MGIKVKIDKESYEKLERSYKSKHDRPNSVKRDFSSCKLIIKASDNDFVNNLMSLEIPEEITQYLPNNIEIEESSKNEIILKCGNEEKRLDSISSLINMIGGNND